MDRQQDTFPSPLTDHAPGGAGSGSASWQAGSPASSIPPRADLFTPARQARFLAALAACGSARAACGRVGISPQAVYLLRRRSALFAAGWEAALVLARQVAEDVLAVRALDGVAEPVFYRGEQVGVRHRYDARLLLAHLGRLDAQIAASPHAAQRAGRFDELLAMVSGAAPPPDMAPAAAGYPGQGRAPDPVLPAGREDHIEQTVQALDPGVSERTMARRCAAAGAAWDQWQAAAQAAADGLVGAQAGQGEQAGQDERAGQGAQGRMEYKSRMGPGGAPLRGRTVSTVSTGVDPGAATDLSPSPAQPERGLERAWSTAIAAIPHSLPPGPASGFLARR